MKYCLSSRQDDEYLRQADEIRFFYSDKDKIDDYITRYPRATMVLELSRNVDDEIDWNTISYYQKSLGIHFIVCAFNAEQLRKCATIPNLRFYYNFPVTSFYELRALDQLGVCYISLGAPLFFQLKAVQNATSTPLRLVPNVAYYDLIPCGDGVQGTWVRPEDITTYEHYFTTCEFEYINNIQERALFRIYAIEREWPGDIKDIVFNFHNPAVNRLVLTPSFGMIRTNCGQTCQSRGDCNICYRALGMATEEKMKEIQDAILKN